MKCLHSRVVADSSSIAEGILYWQSSISLKDYFLNGYLFMLQFSLLFDFLSLSFSLSLLLSLSLSLSLTDWSKGIIQIFTARLGLSVRITQINFQKIPFINLSLSLNDTSATSPPHYLVSKLCGMEEGRFCANINRWKGEPW